MEVTPRDRTAYLAYLQTPDWRRQRNRALRLAGFQCSKCAARRGLEVHHLTYERLGREAERDLEVLCRDCHEGHHIEQMAASDGAVYLKLAHEIIAVRTFHSISDLSAEMKRHCAKLKLPYDAWQVDKALQFVTRATKFSEPIPATQPAVEAQMGRALSDRESQEVLRRLGMDGLIKEMPRAAPSPIDIYGPVPHDEQWGDHDRY